jgi:hypothetical protein
MKTCFISVRALLVATLLAFCASPINAAADAKTESLKNAQDELATLKNKYTDTHPRVIEQNQRITQLQHRIDEDRQERAESKERVNAEVRRRRELRATTSEARGDGKQSVLPNAEIIRTEVRLVNPKPDGSVDLLASPTLITQSGQEASLSMGAFGIVLHSSIDEQNNITTSIELSINGSDGKPAEKIKLPLVKNRPGALSTINVAGAPSVEIRATLVDPKGISVDFAGGTLAQLLAAIDESNSEAFNLIASNEALGLPIPQFSLRNVSPHNLALALNQIVEGYTVDFPRGEREREGQPVFTIRSNLTSNSASKSEKPKGEQFRSYAINRAVLNQIPVDQVIEAINAAWKLDSAHRAEDLTLKYHATTGILLVSSRDGNALQTTNQVIDSLREQAEFLQHLATKPTPAINPKP